MSKKISWFPKPGHNHLVHFYPHQDELIGALFDYVCAGLKSGETCIVIATQRHIESLHKRFAAKKIDITSASQSGQYLEFDATNTLSTFMVDGLPDNERFMKTIGRIVSLVSGRGKPVRAFGEMVALLWKEGNTKGMIQLEELWNGIARENAFSLYCAYPEIYFDGSTQHHKVIEKIKKTHSVATGSFCKPSFL